MQSLIHTLLGSARPNLPPICIKTRRQRCNSNQARFSRVDTSTAHPCLTAGSIAQMATLPC